MSKWAALKQRIELDWRVEWRDVAAGTLTQEQPKDVIELVLEMDRAYWRDDRVQFLELKRQLVSRPSWSGSRLDSGAPPTPTPERSTAGSIKQGSLIW